MLSLEVACEGGNGLPGPRDEAGPCRALSQSQGREAVEIHREVPLTMDDILRATGVELLYGSQRAVSGVDFALSPGEVCAIMGSSGSGSSSSTGSYCRS